MTKPLSIDDLDEDFVRWARRRVGMQAQCDECEQPAGYDIGWTLLCEAHSMCRTS